MNYLVFLDPPGRFPFWDSAIRNARTAARRLVRHREHPRAIAVRAQRLADRNQPGIRSVSPGSECRSHLHRRDIDADILAGGKMAKMNGGGLLRRCQFRHAFKKGLYRFRHPPLHRLVDDILCILFPAIHGIDKRPVAPGIAIAFHQQRIELRFCPVDVAADPQRNGIALDQLVRAAIAYCQLIVLLGIPVASDEIIGKAAIGSNFARCYTIRNRLIEIAQGAKRIFLGQQRPAETGLDPAARAINLVSLGQEADRRPQVAHFERRETGIGESRGIIGVERNPAQRILQNFAVGLRTILGRDRLLRNAGRD